MHVYDSTGTYTVSLTITDSNAQSRTITRTIVVQEDCNLAARAICQAEGATCDIIHGSEGSPIELCRWGAKDTADLCFGSGGVWTDSDSGYAKSHPDAVPAGVPGSCISQLSNFICDPTSDILCQGLGGYCDVVHANNGSPADACRWDVGIPLCETETRGIWTSSTSGYAQSHPDAVPAGSPGACLTQVSNLRCNSSAQELCESRGATCDKVLHASSGTKYNTCRWIEADTEATCSDTSAGLWTLPSASYPGTVPPGAAGALLDPRE